MTPEYKSISSLHKQSRSCGAVRFLVAAACALLLFLAVAPDAVAQTPTMIVMRAMPEKTKRGENFDSLPPLTQADVAQIKIGGKVAPVISFTPLLKGPHVLQLMILLDSMQMVGSQGQFEDIESFLNGLPSNVEIGLGWLLQSQVKVVQDFTTDRTLVYKKLIPQTKTEAANPLNDNGNPFSCLGWLSAHWPDPDAAKLRAVLMFTDGIIRNNSIPQNREEFNPDATTASLRLQDASIQPFPFFWVDPIPASPRGEGGALEGQDLFSQMVTNASGAALYQGLFAPGSFTPLLNRMYSILASESVVTVNAPQKPGKFEHLDIKVARSDIKAFAPDSVMTGNLVK